MRPVFDTVSYRIIPYFVSYLCLFFLTGKMIAQNSDAPAEVSNTTYIRDVFVIQKPGMAPEKTNLLLKNGLIENIGKTVKPTPDAIILKGDSLYVYAGFIDAFSHTGIVKPENKDQQKITDPGNPPNEVAGITPQKSAAEVYKSGDKSVSELRSMGFTTAHVAPRGLMLPGQSALFLLHDGETDAMIVKKNTGMVAQFTTNRGTYPSTVIGVMAKFRELYKNAEILGQSSDSYQLNPAGLQRPLIKKEEEALIPVARKKMPVYFVSSTSNQMYRSIQLQKELGFSMVLTDVKQGFEMMDDLKKINAQYILSLDLPEEKKEAKEDKDKQEKPKTEEEKTFEEKRNQSYQKYIGQAAVFEKAGIPFSFSCLSVKTGDIHKNVRRMVKEGLSEKAALEALTTTPATLLGVSGIMGTVEKGKLANFVITDKPFFDEKSKIKYVFIEGKKYDFPTKPEKPEGEGGEKGKLSGTWTFAVEAGNENHSGTMTITGKGNQYNISVTSDNNPNQSENAFDIVVKENNITFSVTSNVNGQTLTYDFDLFFDTKTFKGNVAVEEMGSYTITGELKSPPKS